MKKYAGWPFICMEIVPAAEIEKAYWRSDRISTSRSKDRFTIQRRLNPFTSGTYTWSDAYANTLCIASLESARQLNRGAVQVTVDSQKIVYM